MVDYHLHSSFSKDGNDSIYDICLSAKEKGVKYIAITDHLDFDDKFLESWEIKDIGGDNGYIATINKMQDEFPELDITLGVEAGYTPSGNERIKSNIKKIAPDFVIGSLHFIEGVDIFESEFFEGKSKKEAYDFYFERLYEAVEPLSKYSNVLGHLTFICKSPNVPYADPKVHYSEHKELIDGILKKTIKCGMGMEINTSGLLKKVNELLPHYEIVKRYKELGGEVLTIGSDAHTAHNIGTGLKEAYLVAKEAGFKYLTVFPEGKQKHIKI